MVEAHTAGAARVDAAGPDEIVFGLNSTSLTFYFSRMVWRTLKAGDEIMLTRMAALSNHADRPTMPGIVAEKKRWKNQVDRPRVSNRWRSIRGGGPRRLPEIPGPGRSPQPRRRP
jgi:hypothetical protein